MGLLRRSARTLALSVALLAAGCCVNPVDPPPPFDPCAPFGCADAGGGFPLDGSLRPPPVELCAQPDFGAPCERACGSDGLTCFRERRASADVAIEGEDAGVATLEAVGFPDGLCSIGCASDGDCGLCARCVPHVLAGRARLRGLVGGSGVCRPSCTSGIGCREGTVCDEATGACLEACISDLQCRFTTVDSDGDGVEDALAYEAESTLVCASGRCVDGAAALGGTCRGDGECEVGYVCMHSAGREGRCARSGCAPGSCGEAAKCVVLEDGTTACARNCVIAADREGERVGVLGRGAGCDHGFACVWSGSGGSDGACIPGAYNDVMAPNVGAPCAADDDCFSPYGRGVCLRAREGEPNGACAVYDCMEPETGNWVLPGVELPPSPTLCDTDTGATCSFPLAADLRTLCARGCDDAADCLPGWACVAILDTQRVCFPDCTADADCGAGTACVAPGGAACTESDRGCACQ